MRTATKNEVAIWYANYEGETEELEDGMHTGRYYPSYSEPVKVFMNIGGTRWSARWELNGFETDYRRDIVTCDKTLGWKVNTVLWVDIDPVDDEGNEVKHNFIVEKVSPTKNVIRYTLREVQTS